MLEYAFCNGNLVYIEDAIKGQVYTCPDCNDVLIVKNRKFDGRKKDYHYAHESGTDCAQLHKGESDVHRNTKFFVYKMFLNAQNCIIRHICKVNTTGYILEYDILNRVAEIVMEKRTISKFIPDISLKTSQGDLIRAVEIVYKHEDTEEKTASYKENHIDVIKIVTDEEIYKDIKLGKKPNMELKKHSKRIVLLKGLFDF